MTITQVDLATWKRIKRAEIDALNRRAEYLKERALETRMAAILAQEQLRREMNGH